MKENTKKIILHILKETGGFGIARRICRNIPRILMYHRIEYHSSWRGISGNIFEQQMKALRKGFNIISLGDLCNRVCNGDSIPSDTVVVTIDDGYEDFYIYAYPILKRYSVPATVYLTTDFVDQKIWLWPDVIDFILSRTKFSSYSLTRNGEVRQYKLSEGPGRREAWSQIGGYCLTLRDRERKEFVRQLGDDLKVDIDPVPVPEYRGLTWDQVREMKKYGVDVGSHTSTHPRLVMVDQTNLFREIEGSRKRIQEELNEGVDSFCYPNGTRMDFDEKIKEMVRRAGYRSATVGYWDPSGHIDLFELGRHGIGSDMFHFSKVIHGVENLSVLMRKKAWKFYS